MQGPSPLQRTGGGAGARPSGGASPGTGDSGLHSSAELYPRSFKLQRSGSTDSLASMVRARMHIV